MSYVWKGIGARSDDGGKRGEHSGESETQQHSEEKHRANGRAPSQLENILIGDKPTNQFPLVTYRLKMRGLIVFPLYLAVIK